MASRRLIRPWSLMFGSPVVVKGSAFDGDHGGPKGWSPGIGRTLRPRRRDGPKPLRADPGASALRTSTASSRDSAAELGHRVGHVDADRLLADEQRVAARLTVGMDGRDQPDDVLFASRRGWSSRQVLSGPPRRARAPLGGRPQPGPRPTASIASTSGRAPSSGPLRAPREGSFGLPACGLTTRTSRRA